PTDRGAIERVAAAASVPFIGLWLDAPESVLAARAQRRRDDSSDAGADVVRMQAAQDTGPIAWNRLDGSPTATVVLAAAVDEVGKRHHEALNEAANQTGEKRAGTDATREPGQEALDEQTRE
ncbi:MAG: hypothetical protein ACT4QD_05525, partial [Acidobacteriota bacterium]